MALTIKRREMKTFLIRSRPVNLEVEQKEAQLKRKKKKKVLKAVQIQVSKSNFDSIILNVFSIIMFISILVSILQMKIIQE
jgi:hypothetical protein